MAGGATATGVRCRLAAAGPALLLAAGLAGCAPEPPAEPDPLVVLRDYVAALESGDLERARASAWLPRDGARAAEGVARLRATVGFLQDGTLRLEALEARAAGDWALAALRVTQAVPGGEVEVVRPERLLRVEGRWLVVAPSRLADPELPALPAEDQRRLEAWFREVEPAFSGGGRPAER